MENIKDYVLRQKQKLKEKIEALQHKPTLAIIQVGHVEASNRYVKNKIKDANEISLPVKLISCEEDISEEELLNIIKQLNDDPNITALICQLPLPKHIKLPSLMFMGMISFSSACADTEPFLKIIFFVSI